MTPLGVAEVAHSEQKLPAQDCFYRVGQQSSLEVTQLEDLRLLRMRYDRQIDQHRAKCDEIASAHESKVFKLGYLHGGLLSDPIEANLRRQFLLGMRDLGYA